MPTDSSNEPACLIASEIANTDILKREIAGLKKDIVALKSALHTAHNFGPGSIYFIRADERLGVTIEHRPEGSLITLEKPANVDA